jgi:hypothetical protein
MLTDNIQDKDDQAKLTELQNRLAEETKLELLRLPDFEDVTDFDVTFDAEYYHSRFDTTIRVRPAPHTDLSLEVLSVTQNKYKTYIKYFILPASKEGMWIRLFSGCGDP